jgi:hypothetical protein
LRSLLMAGVYPETGDCGKANLCCNFRSLAERSGHRGPSPRPIDVTGQPCSPDRGPAVRQNLVSSRSRRRNLV